MSRCRISIRGAARLAAALGVIVIAAPESISAGAEESRPNFVLCMADDQGWGDVGHRDPQLKTPTMDELAATGLRLDRFYAAAPVCSPTRGSVMTGRHPNRFGCFSWGHTLRPQEITVAEALKTAGYATGHFGKWHLGDVTANSPVSPGGSGFDVWLSAPNFFENNPLLSREGKVIQTHGEGSHVTVDAALEFIRDCAARQQPFLAVVWFGSPHGPHEALAEYRKPYADLPANKQHFYGEITAMDAALGKLRRELRDLDIAENTVLWYTSDNGALPVGSSGGLRGRKGDIYEGGLRVPCMIEWPARIQKPRASEVPAGTVDIYPTVLELAGVEMEDQVRPLDGVSLVPLIEGAMESCDKPLGFWEHPARGISTPSHRILQALLEKQRGGQSEDEPRPVKEPGRVPRRKRASPVKELPGAPQPSSIAGARQYPEDVLPGHSAWVDGDWKLHRIANAEGNAKYELYNLAEDVEESNNVLAAHPDRAAQMQEALETWQGSVVRSLNGEDY
ncbi:MAG: sulfatase-like hydrolase/transferase [Planctomycetes bacterium]|nr:sulfatase-like hydrolase/transferase [Planctomycetota bacterium]